MPTITPNVRTTIGGSPQDPRPTRVSVTASTGMGINKPSQVEQPAKTQTPDSGQPGTKEETTDTAVTLSPQMTALARKQQTLQREVQMLRDKEAAFNAKAADYVPKSEFKAKLQENAAEALKALGTDYEELTQTILQQQTAADPVKALEAKLEKLEKSQEENVNKQYEATLKQYRAETDSLVASDKKSYHFVANLEGQDAVVQHILETWKENPDKVLTVEEATKDIEGYFREQAKKYKALLAEIEEPAPVVEEPKKTLPPPTRTVPKTLTNQVESTPQRSSNQFQYLSAYERLQQAIARAQQ